MICRKFSEDDIYDYIFRKELPVSAEFVLSYWDKKKWLTKEGHTVKTLSAAVNVCNSIYLLQLKKKLGIAKYKEAIRNTKKIFEKYKIQLQSEEWKAFRQFIFVVRGCSCEICGSKSNIQVHHKKYIKGRRAWEYLPDDVLVVCGSCHKHLHNIL